MAAIHPPVATAALKRATSAPVPLALATVAIGATRAPAMMAEMPTRAVTRAVTGEATAAVAMVGAATGAEAMPAAAIGVEAAATSEVEAAAIGKPLFSAQA